jgi:hypothetical protein
MATPEIAERSIIATRRGHILLFVVPALKDRAKLIPTLRVEIQDPEAGNAESLSI